MKCKNCHAENPDDALNCKKCGAVPDEDTGPNTDRGIETVILDSGTRLNIDPLGFGPGEKFGFKISHKDTRI